MSDKIIASEAIYGFAAWLTCRKDPVVLGAAHDASIAAKLVEEWCKINILLPPRAGVYPDNIIQPKTETEYEK